MRPFGSMTNVDRMVPVTGLPYIIFCPYAPYARATTLLGSLSSGKGSSYFSRNRSCDPSESFETPYTTAPGLPSRAIESRKSQASRVQPGVWSFG